MSEASNPQPVPTLGSVQLAFEHWRSTRIRRLPPLSLQRLAAALLSDHRPTHICVALKINTTVLRSWATTPKSTPLSPVSTPIQSDAQFIELPTEPCSDSSASERNTIITIDLKEGLRLSINGHFTLDDIIQAACQQRQEESS